MEGEGEIMKNRIDAKIMKLEAKVEAWNDTWGKVKPDVPVYKIDELEITLTKLYELRKLRGFKSYKTRGVS